MKAKLRLKEAREARGLSQRYVAEQLNLAPSSVAKWEIGMCNPTVDNLIALAALFQCDLNTLVDHSPQLHDTGERKLRPCQITTEISTKQPVSRQV